MWSFRQVDEFCSGYPQCNDGGLPWVGNVVADKSGHLYGTARDGGANGGGVVYELAPGARKNWTETILHSFCSLADCADGEGPSGTLLLDSVGNLYGTTESGSDNCAVPARCGVVFELAADSQWQESVLHTFCQESNCTDGSGAQGGLVMDEDGNLLGATYVGGTQNDGAVFQLGQSFSVLHSFCTDSGCSDGQYPWPAIAQDGSGNTFGITQKGGSASYGAVFEISK